MNKRFLFCLLVKKNSIIDWLVFTVESHEILSAWSFGVPCNLGLFYINSKLILTEQYCVLDYMIVE